MRDDIRIVLVGDGGVGKSTLVTALIKETFIVNVQSVVPEVTIPPEVTPENVTTHIIDTSSKGEDQEVLETELRKANVACIVYAIDDRSSFQRVHEYWLPLLRLQGINLPVILVGNKVDMRDEDIGHAAVLEDEVVPIMNEYREIEVCVECSAKALLNVSELFYFAQKAVLHPTRPLYDARDHVMKPKCTEALIRIFRLCDTDGDGVLNDAELNEFQRKCFNTPLQQRELEGVKEIVKASRPDGVTDIGLNVQGFLYLHLLFIQRGRVETTWMVLRKFGYGDDLGLREDYLCPDFDVPPDCCVELSPGGYAFLTEIFKRYDADGDSAFCPEELENIFSLSPGIPWKHGKFPESTVTNAAGYVTLEGWLAQWSMTTLLDHKQTLAYLAYFGFPADIRDGICIASRDSSGSSGPRKRRKGKMQRNVFLCYVVGAAGSGKTSLIRAFAKKPFLQDYVPTTRSTTTVNSVDVKGSEKYLVMQEFGPYDTSVLQSRRQLEFCDLLVMAYDSSDPNSFSYLANLRKNYSLDSVPVIFVATKSDLDYVEQRGEQPPDIYCRELKLNAPVYVSVKDSQIANVFQRMAAITRSPQSATPALLLSRPHAWSATKIIGVTALAGVGLVSTFAVYQALKYWWTSIMHSRASSSYSIPRRNEL
ncbi:ERMES complex Ca(2+)-binding regulatory GTPase gem1 [Coemansia spiralis]|uniref:Mitochondrial Rho GTPase n=2 Tax=Coemansia TaxID=4863 RepID=A0A9W8KUF8_9FUNG|nr:ERMES complex Ca(2+)-binding regulatory GTPase gem1 [Coemansia umbellata]KAJ2621352.1 ERMES complex Ca(2+)-binding regulatory GTPase gem1 [Coemansia sp. RSA 1358]KAJ2670898.1 ERMES complex Ca(2+)-binding regulatory GTPase gem1 [Coemansia spiralis]